MVFVNREGYGNLVLARIYNIVCGAVGQSAVLAYNLILIAYAKRDNLFGNVGCDKLARKLIAVIVINRNVIEGNTVNAVVVDF